MAILLKDYLSLNESVRYKPPFINVIKKGQEDDTTRNAARTLFYDFYAMEYLHRTLGSQYTDVSPKKKSNSQLSALKGQFYNFYGDDAHLASLKENDSDTNKSKHDKIDKIKKDVNLSMMGVAGAANWEDIDEPISGIILPHKFRSIIDDVYDQVTTIMAHKLLAHLRLTIIQEFRYLTSKSDFSIFRMQLVSDYNLKKQFNSKFTNEDLEKLVKTNIPNMSDHIPSVKKLLIYARYYSKLTGQDGKDPSQEIEKDDSGEDYYDIEKDPNAVDISKDKSDIEVPDGEEIPDYPDYEYPSGEFNPDDPFDKGKKKNKLHEYLSGIMDPPSILKVKRAIDKAKLSWEDIILGYKNIRWSGGYGGEKWGIGAEAFVKLKEATEKHNTKQMAGHIDHIFDLQHNSGALLNKGGMFVSSEDLDKRAKISSVLCYLDEVSPTIKTIIKNTIRYTSSTPELDLSIDKYISSEKKPFTEDEAKKLLSHRFKKDTASHQFIGNAPYENKEGALIPRNFYIISHTNGLYSLHDDKKTDKRLFKTFDELENYISTHIVSNLVTPKSSLIRLSADKEKQLLDLCKMGWREGSKRYKAYLSDGDKCYLKAADDGSFEIYNSIASGKLITTNWEEALEYAKIRTITAKPYPGSRTTAQNVNVSTPSLGQTSSTNSPIGNNQYVALSSADFAVLIKTHGYQILHDKVQKGNNNGVPYYSVGIILPNGFTEPIFYYPETKLFVYNNNLTTYDIAYVINYLKSKGQSSINAINYLKSKEQAHIINSPKGDTLPDHSKSKASYKVHVGINKFPTNSIRLTIYDEGLLKDKGFFPKLIGGLVWYVHSGCGDAVRFYPNDTANLQFANITSTTALKLNIEKMLSWLSDHYNIDTKKSGIEPLTLSGRNWCY